MKMFTSECFYSKWKCLLFKVSIQIKKRKDKIIMSKQQNKNTHSLNSNVIFVIGALGGLLFGFDTGIISGASPLIEKALHLTISEISLLMLQN